MKGSASSRSLKIGSLTTPMRLFRMEASPFKKWLKDLKNPYQVVLKDEKGSFGLDLGVYGAPETFIVDGKGIIHYRHAGDVNANVWKEKLLPIYTKLAEQK